MVKVLGVMDVMEAKARARDLMAVVQRMDNEHLVYQHDAVALADGTLGLIFEEVSGGNLADVLDARGSLTHGETITIIAPLFRALADLHASGIVHGALRPGSVLFSDEGRPLTCVFDATESPEGRLGADGEPSCFTAPELATGADPSPASDVYAMAAIGWICLTGDPPVPAPDAGDLTLSPETPFRLVEILAGCLSIDPVARPSADQVAAEVFATARAEPVRMGPSTDPAAEITRRIRQTAVSLPAATPTGKQQRPTVLIGVLALVVALALAGGGTWLLRHRPPDAHPRAVRLAQSVPTPRQTTVAMTHPAKTPERIREVVTATDSPRKAAAALLQALVDARALAYVARDPGLLDLVYAPGAVKSGVDRSNISTAVRNGATYLGLGFVVKDATFQDGTSVTARIRATIVTTAFETRRSDGRKVPHHVEVSGPSVFTLRLVPVGWRILSMTAG